MAALAMLGVAHIHTPNFVKTLAARTDHAVASVWDHDAAGAARVAQMLGARAVATAEAALDGVDAAIVCAETVRHEALVSAAAAAGKHLFVEKPLGMGAADAERMRRAIDGAQVRFQTGFFMRSLPIFRFVKAHLEAGTFGQVTRIRHSNCHAGALKGWFDSEWRWMADPAQAGVGAFGDLGAHSLDLLLWLMDDVEAVTADIRAATGRYKECDEYGEAMLRFRGGAIGTIAAGWVDVANAATLAISGTEGAVWVFNQQLFVACEKLPGADGRTPWTDLPEAKAHAFDQFLDALSGGPAELVGVAEAARGCAVMEAFYRAAREQRWVQV